MTTESNSNDVVSNYYDEYKQNQEYILKLESRKVRNSIFIVAALLFGSEFLGLMMANLVTVTNTLASAIIPLILVGIGFLALRLPLLAIILATLVFAGLIVLTIVLLGGAGAISGLLVKAIVIYFLVAGFQSARQAELARKEVKA
jgi:hypothetical protein